MNQYGEMARRHWAWWLPKRLAAIENPEAFFTGLGDEAEQRITALAWELAGDDPPDEGYLDKAGRLGEARHRAEQIVLNEMILLPPEPGTGPASPQ
ncbi:MAG TPA: hypothetical protein VF933_14100 [Streptosporangiaceae bacterium]